MYHSVFDRIPLCLSRRLTAIPRASSQLNRSWPSVHGPLFAVPPTVDRILECPIVHICKLQNRIVHTNWQRIIFSHDVYLDVTLPHVSKYFPTAAFFSTLCCSISRRRAKSAWILLVFILLCVNAKRTKLLHLDRPKKKSEWKYS